MHSALRPYVTNGVVLVGCAALVASPIALAPQLHLTPAPLAAVSSDLQLTSVATDLAAAVNSVIDGFLNAGFAGVVAASGAIGASTLWITDGINTGASILSGVAALLPYMATQIGDGFTGALTDLFGTNAFTAAVTDVTDGFLGAGTAVGDGIGSAVGIGAGAVNDTIFFAGNILTMAITTPATALTQVVNGFQNALTDLAAGNLALVLPDIVGGITAAAQTVITGVTTAFNAGVTLLQSLLTAGTQLLQVAIQTPLVAGQSIVQGFINAFREFFPSPPVTTVTTPGPVASLGTGVLGLRAKANAAASVPTPRAAAAGPASLPRANARTVTLPTKASTTATDVTGAIAATPTPRVKLGQVLSSIASKGKSRAGAAASSDTTPDTPKVRGHHAA